MRHLLNTAVHPRLPLGECLEHWLEIARRLREPPRTRERQGERLAPYLSLLS